MAIDPGAHAGGVIESDLHSHVIPVAAEFALHKRHGALRPVLERRVIKRAGLILSVTLAIQQ